ncbi:MAG: response regulator transcription factor [Bacteroidetes bacterium]|nr:response regulator transcription factor [Bacteroidota bacterium]
MAKFVKVLLVEGHSLMEDIISDELSSIGDTYVIGLCSTPAQVFTFLRCNREEPDMIFLDSKMDERGGYHLCRWLTSHYPKIVVIGMVERDEHLSIRLMTENGIKDHIYKDDGAEIFSRAIENYRNGHYSEQESDHGLLMTDLGSQIAVPVPNEKSNILSDQESEIAMMVINQLSMVEIADIMSMQADEVSKAIDATYKKTNSSNSLQLRRFIIKHMSI